MYHKQHKDQCDQVLCKHRGSGGVTDEWMKGCLNSHKKVCQCAHM